MHIRGVHHVDVHLVGVFLSRAYISKACILALVVGEIFHFYAKLRFVLPADIPQGHVIPTNTVCNQKLTLTVYHRTSWLSYNLLRVYVIWALVSWRCCFCLERFGGP
jgi:hypothetical protein